MKHRPRPPEQDDLLRPRLVDMIDPRQPFTRPVVAQAHDIADAQAHDAGEIMRLRTIKRDRAPLRQQGIDKKARCRGGT